MAPRRSSEASAADDSPVKSRLRFAQVFKAGETKGPLSQPGNLNADRFLDRRRIERAITLHGGGLFVIDPTSTPMEILAEYMGRRSTPMASEVSKRTAACTLTPERVLLTRIRRNSMFIAFRFQICSAELYCPKD